mmetsp:Transcript_1319/g.3894  ORF Transcript_1319/g.3894 Transcript_1319/m.3894 type:complete len:222 (-) Transcript_1319:1232-1897(-)
MPPAQAATPGSARVAVGADHRGAQRIAGQQPLPSERGLGEPQRAVRLFPRRSRDLGRVSQVEQLHLWDQPRPQRGRQRLARSRVGATDACSQSKHLDDPDQSPTAARRQPSHAISPRSWTRWPFASLPSVRLGLVAGAAACEPRPANLDHIDSSGSCRACLSQSVAATGFAIDHERRGASEARKGCERGEERLLEEPARGEAKRKPAWEAMAFCGASTPPG